MGWTVYISFLGVLVLTLLPKRNPQAARIIALLTAVGGLGVAIAGAWDGAPGLRTFCQLPWIPSLGISYHLAVDGISLTLVNVESDRFSVMLIPHTQAATTLGLKKPGDAVNLEADMLAKHVAKLLGK